MDAIKRQMKGTVHTHFEISQNDPFSAADRGYKVAMNLSITLRSISRSISFSWVVCCWENLKTFGIEFLGIDVLDD